MSAKIAILILIAYLFVTGCAQENKTQKEAELNSSQKELQEAPDEMLSSFSVTGYTKGGEKQWDLAGKSADIMSEEIKLTEVTGKVYGKQTNMTILADEGSLNRIDNNVHLEKNVQATTDDGATLTTDYLDWDAQQQKLSSDAPTQIKRGPLEASGTGIVAEPVANLVQLKKDVTVTLSLKDMGQGQNQSDLNQNAVSTPTVITCDGVLEVQYEENLAIFHDNVKVKDERGEIFADRMDVYFAAQAEQKQQLQGIEGMNIDKVVAEGNVEIHHGSNITYSQKAVYDTQTGKLVLTGQPKLVIYSTEDFSQLMGSSKAEGEEKQ